VDGLYRAIDQYGQIIDVLVSGRGIWRPPASSSSGPSNTAPPKPGDYESGTGL
jgi:hypothetical protein